MELGSKAVVICSCLALLLIDCAVLCYIRQFTHSVFPFPLIKGILCRGFKIPKDFSDTTTKDQTILTVILSPNPVYHQQQSQSHCSGAHTLNQIHCPFSADSLLQGSFHFHKFPYPLSFCEHFFSDSLKKKIYIYVFKGLIFPLKLSFKNCQKLTIPCCVWQNKKQPAISELHSFMVLDNMSWAKLSCTMSEDSQNGSLLKVYSQGMSLDASKIPLEICRSITKMCKN